MPVIKIQHISSFSSEDSNHPAVNLLNSETYRKWKCASVGEKQVVVVLQLGRPTQIHGVDIGNEGSAFVEVLVGRSSAPDDYQVLLVTSTFMSPTDSKTWNNTNRVRMFGSEKLSKQVIEEKWDRVKVVCSQPFNKKEKYGLSFITLHSPPSDSEKEGEKKDTPTKKQLGMFTVKEEPKTLESGTLFFKKGTSATSTTPTTPTAAAQARSASTTLKAGRSLSSPRASTVHRAPGNLSKARGQKKKAPSDSSPTGPRTKEAKVSTSGGDDASRNILQGVVFAISGFKNPFRGDLREKAVEMGAVYEPDWTPKCTHLVCAFPNTPKFNQVKAKHGLIVKKEWILDSYVKKRRLPARKYRLSGGSGDSSSEDEFYDTRESTIFKNTSEKKVTTTRVSTVSTESTEHVPAGGEEEDVDPYAGSTDEASDMETDVVVKKKPLPQESSECDTEDEIQRIKAEQDDPYAGSTEEENEEEESQSDSKSLTDLPNFLSHCCFMLYGNFSPTDRRLLHRYITAYNGRIEDYMSDNVTHVITQESWDNNFDRALKEHGNLCFAQPQWIFKCHEKQLCVPCQPYAVVPSS